MDLTNDSFRHNNSDGVLSLQIQSGGVHQSGIDGIIIVVIVVVCLFVLTSFCREQFQELVTDDM